MISALRETVIPVLREMKFSGSFPHFRRAQKDKLDLLTFQFNRHGGSFVVEVAVCGSEGFTTAWGEKIPPNKVSAHDIHPKNRPRLGSQTTGEGIWFSYEPFQPEIYEAVAAKLLSLIRLEAEDFWKAQTVT